MKRIRLPIYYLDAFTTRVFAGNPAAVMFVRPVSRRHSASADCGGEQFEWDGFFG